MSHINISVEGRRENIEIYANRAMEAFYRRHKRINFDETVTYVDTADYNYTSAIKDSTGAVITSFDITKIVTSEDGWIGIALDTTKATLLTDDEYTYDVNFQAIANPEDSGVIQFGNIDIIRNQETLTP